MNGHGKKKKFKSGTPSFSEVALRKAGCGNDFLRLPSGQFMEQQ